MSETTSTPGGFVRADDRQVSGQHYKAMKVQPWTAMEALLTREEFIGFLKGSIVKYSMRQGRKDGSDDGDKALHYIQKLEEVLSGLKPVTPQEIHNSRIRNMLDAAGFNPDAMMTKVSARKHTPYPPSALDPLGRGPDQEGWCNGK